MGKSSINGSFSMAMLNNQRVKLISLHVHGNLTEKTVLDLVGGILEAFRKR